MIIEKYVWEIVGGDELPQCAPVALPPVGTTPLINLDEYDFGD